MRYEARPYFPAEAERLELGFNYLYLSDDSVVINEDIFNEQEPRVLTSFSSLGVPQNQEHYSKAEKEELKRRGFSRRMLADIVESIEPNSVLSYALPQRTSKLSNSKKHN